MKPYYQDSAVTIYHGDCREIVPQLGKFDLLLTDPPYGVGIKYASFNDTPDNVMRIVGEVIPVCLGICRRGAITCGQTQIHFYPPPTWILCWLNKAGANQNPWGFSCWSPVLVYGKDPFRENGDGARPDYLEHSEKADSLGHPCPKPQMFWNKLMHRCSIDSNETVLDPFAGSGTTGRAAKDLGRKATLIEIEERYCEIAAKRMAQEVLNL